MLISHSLNRRVNKTYGCGKSSLYQLFLKTIEERFLYVLRSESEMSCLSSLQNNDGSWPSYGLCVALISALWFQNAREFSEITLQEHSIWVRNIGCYNLNFHNLLSITINITLKLFNNVWNNSIIKAVSSAFFTNKLLAKVYFFQYLCRPFISKSDTSVVAIHKTQMEFHQLSLVRNNCII